MDIEDTNTKQQKSTPARRFADLMGETTETLPSPNGKLPDDTSSTTTTTTTTANTTTTTTQGQTSSTTAQPSRPADADFTSSSSNQPTVLQQTVTVGKDGKRRIKPVTIRSSSSTVSPGPRPASPKVQSAQVSYFTQGCIHTILKHDGSIAHEYYGSKTCSQCCEVGGWHYL